MPRLVATPNCYPRQGELCRCPPAAQGHCGRGHCVTVPWRRWRMTTAAASVATRPGRAPARSSASFRRRAGTSAPQAISAVSAPRTPRCLSNVSGLTVRDLWAQPIGGATDGGTIAAMTDNASTVLREALTLPPDEVHTSPQTSSPASTRNATTTPRSRPHGPTSLNVAAGRFCGIPLQVRAGTVPGTASPVG